MSNIGHMSYGQISLGTLIPSPSYLHRSLCMLCRHEMRLGRRRNQAEARGWELWLRGGYLVLASKVLQLFPLPAGSGGLGYSQLPAHSPR